MGCTNVRLAGLVAICVLGLLVWPCHADEQRDLYSSLELQFYRGDVQAVIKAINEQESGGHSIGFALAHLRARAAAHDYFQYWSEQKVNTRAPEPPEWVELRKRARACTVYYEKALASAVSTNDRVLCAIEWWRMNVDSWYDGDSEVLREAVQWVQKIREGVQKDAGINAARVLRNVYRGTIEATPLRRSLSETKKRALAEIVGEELTRAFLYAPSEEQVEAMARGFPVFAGFCLPVNEQTNEETFRRTVQWHLQQAVTYHKPSPEVRAMVDAQIQAYADQLESEMDRIFKHDAVAPLGSHYKAQLLYAYERLRDNPLVPYFNRPLLPYQMRSIAKGIKRLTDQAESNWKASLADLTRRRHRDPDKLPDQIRSHTIGYQDALYGLSFGAIVRYQSPVLGIHLPGTMIVSDRGHLEKSGVYVFSVGRLEELPPGPVKKWWQGS